MSAALQITAQGDCFLADQLLHPAGQALAAARQDLAPLLSGARPEDTLVLAGLGLGWHAQAVRERPAPPHLLVYEPDPVRRAMAAALGPALPGGSGSTLINDSQELIESLAPRLVYGQSGRVAIYCHAAYRLAAPEVLEQAQAMLLRSQQRGQVELANRRAKQEIWLRHLADNFNLALKLPDITQLIGWGKGRPALVVGAGPSLDQSLPLLAGIEQRCLVLAAASALRPLAGVGVAPHLALAMEAKDESRQFAGANFKRTILAAASSSHPNHFANWSGFKALIHLQPWVSHLAGTGLALPSGGHVTSLAFSLAVLMGCDPIILVGQDLAFSQGRQHASLRPGGEDDAIPQTVHVQAIGGGHAETSLVMQSYIAWYQEAAAYLARQPQPPRIINATSQGALLAGFAHQSLGEALDGLPTCSDCFTRLGQALSHPKLPQASDLSLRLGLARTEVRRSLALLEQGGLEACRSGIASEGPVAAALQDLPPGAGHLEAIKALSFMSDILRQMAEGLYV